MNRPHAAAMAWSAAILSAALAVRPLAGAEHTVDVRDLGAVGDGKRPCTPAIQKAIDQCAARGGGTVRLPAGTWLTGTVYLESNLTLVLDKGCTLLGSRKHEDYAGPRASAGPDAQRAGFRYAAILAGIALEIVDGGTLDKVAVSGIRIDGPSVAIFLRLGNRGRTYEGKSPKPEVGTLRSVVLRDITAENTSQIGCSITGLPGHPVRDIVLENLKLGFDGGAAKELASRTVAEKDESYPESTMFGTLPAYGFYCRHVEGLVFRNVTLRTRRPDLRHAMVFDDVKRLTIEALDADFATEAAAAIRLAQVEGAAIRRCKAPAAADPFLLLEGDRTRQIAIEQNELGPAAKAVVFGRGASRQALSSE
jgi:hypothetical protein